MCLPTTRIFTCLYLFDLMKYYTTFTFVYLQRRKAAAQVNVLQTFAGRFFWSCRFYGSTPFFTFISTKSKIYECTDICNNTHKATHLRISLYHSWHFRGELLFSVHFWTLWSHILVQNISIISCPTPQHQTHGPN